MSSDPCRLIPVGQGEVQTGITLEAEGGQEGPLETALKALLEGLPDDSVAKVEQAVSDECTIASGN